LLQTFGSDLFAAANPSFGGFSRAGFLGHIYFGFLEL
jgi:hypothetical protein